MYWLLYIILISTGIDGFIQLERARLKALDLHPFKSNAELKKLYFSRKDKQLCDIYDRPMKRIGFGFAAFICVAVAQVLYNMLTGQFDWTS